MKTRYLICFLIIWRDRKKTQDSSFETVLIYPQTCKQRSSELTVQLKHQLTINDPY